MNTTLVVRPAGGLCNRLYAIASAMIYARDLGFECRVHWVPDPACACALTDLIDGIPNLSDEEVEATGVEFTDIHESTDYMQLPAEAGGGANLGFYAYFKFKSAARALADYEQQLHQYLSALRVVPEVAAAVMPLPPGTIGMHVRRGDHWRSWRYSPASLFRRAAERHLAENPDSKIFLATDSPELETAFKARYRGRVLSYGGRKLDRTSREGVRAALIDLLTLANTDLIYGSFSSSFSMLAARFRNTPLEILQRRRFPRDWNERPADVRHDRIMRWVANQARWTPRRHPRPGDAPIRRLAVWRTRWLAAYVQSNLYQHHIPWSRSAR